jgi:hypothetical protein
MASLYTQSFAIVQAGVGDSDPYLVPEGFRWVIRDISMWNGNLLEVVDASVTTVGGAAIAHGNGPEIAGQWYFHEEGRWVLPDAGPDGFFQLHATFPVDFVISGYALTLP